MTKMIITTKIDICIYCRNRKATERDHVPPQCFFSTPKPSNLITVPCCSVCNRDYGKVDERIRNILTSLETTENHDAIQNQLAKKRNASYSRDKGRSNFHHLLESMQMADVYSKRGIFIGKKPAFKLNQPIFDKFFKRLVKAFIFIHNNMFDYNLRIEWKLSPNIDIINTMPQQLKDFISNPRIHKSIGKDIFEYAGWYLDNIVRSLWSFNFYNGIEFDVQASEID